MTLSTEHDFRRNIKAFGRGFPERVTLVQASYTCGKGADDFAATLFRCFDSMLID